MCVQVSPVDRSPANHGAHLSAAACDILDGQIGGYERLENSTPGFTMAAYQHVIPGMQVQAAQIFAGILQRCADLPASTRQKSR